MVDIYLYLIEMYIIVQIYHDYLCGNLLYDNFNLTMRQNLLFILGALSAMPGAAATDIPDGWSLYDLIPPADRVLLFDYDAEGKKLPILAKRTI